MGQTSFHPWLFLTIRVSFFRKDEQDSHTGLLINSLTLRYLVEVHNPSFSIFFTFRWSQVPSNRLIDFSRVLFVVWPQSVTLIWTRPGKGEKSREEVLIIHPRPEFFSFSLHIRSFFLSRVWQFLYVRSPRPSLIWIRTLELTRSKNKASWTSAAGISVSLFKATFLGWQHKEVFSSLHFHIFDQYSRGDFIAVISNYATRIYKLLNARNLLQINGDKKSTMTRQIKNLCFVGINLQPNSLPFFPG